MFATVGIVAVLSLARSLLSARFSYEPPKPATLPGKDFAPVALKARTFRPAVKPKGTLSPKLARVNISVEPLADMDDHGEYLFLASAPDAPYREYALYKNGQRTNLGHLTTDIRYFLSDTGKVVRRIAPAQMTSMAARFANGPVTSSFNEIRFTRRFYDDGSILIVRFELQKKQSVYRLNLENAKGTRSTLYTTPNMISLLERSDDNTIWVRESLQANTSGNDALLRIVHGKVERMAMPTKYRAVDRVAQTGSLVAATFGFFQGTEPLRSFVLQKNGWHELPLPDGYAFSYVQKVLFDGSIIGFVTDGERQHFRQVIWKGDSVAILDDMPAWPKNGQLSFITQATRKGDIYVRNVTDTASGVSEYYLLSVRP